MFPQFTIKQNLLQSRYGFLLTTFKSFSTYGLGGQELAFVSAYFTNGKSDDGSLIYFEGYTE